MKKFQNILVVVDSSQSTHSALERAMKLAGQGGGKLHLIEVVKDAGLALRWLSRDYVHIHELLVRERQQGLQGLLELCKSHGIDATGEVLEGVSSQVTIDTVQRIGAQLVIREAKGERSLATGSLGTSAMKLIRRPPCAVWLAQPQHEPQCKVIVAAVDASPHDDAHGKLNRRILEIGCELAKQERSKLLVCYVWSLYGAEMLSHRLPEQEFARLTAHNRKQHLESFEKLLAEFKLHATGPSAHMLEGEPSLEIPALCHREGADLLLCGTVARQGIPGLLIGNTAERIISRVDCSILALTPQS